MVVVKGNSRQPVLNYPSKKGDGDNSFKEKKKDLLPCPQDQGSPGRDPSLVGRELSEGWKLVPRLPGTQVNCC